MADSAALCCVLCVELRAANGVKDALKAAGLLDQTRLSLREADGRVALPCVPHAAAAACPAAVAAALASGAASWGERATEARRGTTASPAACLRASVTTLLSAAGAPASLLDDLPRRWELLGDVALLPASCLHDARWAQHAGLLDAVWPAVAAALGARRLARQAAVDPGPRRSSRAVLVFPPGESCGWTRVRENGLWYTLDVTQSMFSSGNGTEKARMAALSAGGQTVVDCFAGIGYYTLPLLLHAGAAHVYACEWNPPSLEALRRGLALNAVAPGKCTVLEGDCALTAPRGVAQRVLLGLLPSSECAWPAAAAALADGGGTAHVHANVRAGGQAAWAQEAAAELQRLARALPGREAWTASVTHLEVVKSYAPRVLHVVADVRLGPPAASQALARPSLAAAPHAPSQPPQVLQSPTPEALAAAAVRPRRPALLRGLDFGPAAALWREPAHFERSPDGAAPVSVHVARSPELDWHARSFEYEVIPLARLVRLIARTERHPAEAADAQPRHYYMRAVGRDPRKEAACLAASFPVLAAELALPPACVPPPPAQPHSSVLRLASPGLALWLHYDVLDNVLLQLAGSKRVLLFPPHAAGGLYLTGSSSALPTRALWAVPGGEEAARLHAAFPRYAAARAAATEVVLAPGEALFIPALWAHAVRCDAFSVAVNVFWPAAGAPGPRDVYGNVDAPAAADVLAAAATAAAALRRLPPDAAAFYMERAVAMLQDAALR